MYTRNYTDMWKNIFGLRIVEKIDLERDATVEREDVNKNRVAEEAAEGGQNPADVRSASEPTTSLSSLHTHLQSRFIP